MILLSNRRRVAAGQRFLSPTCRCSTPGWSYCPPLQAASRSPLHNLCWCRDNTRQAEPRAPPPPQHPHLVRKHTVTISISLIYGRFFRFQEYCQCFQGDYLWQTHMQSRCQIQTWCLHEVCTCPRLPCSGGLVWEWHVLQTSESEPTWRASRGRLVDDRQKGKTCGGGLERQPQGTSVPSL